MTCNEVGDWLYRYRRSWNEGMMHLFAPFLWGSCIHLLLDKNLAFRQNPCMSLLIDFSKATSIRIDLPKKCRHQLSPTSFVSLRPHVRIHSSHQCLIGILEWPPIAHTFLEISLFCTLMKKNCFITDFASSTFNRSIIRILIAIRWIECNDVGCCGGCFFCRTLPYILKYGLVGGIGFGHNIVVYHHVVQRPTGHWGWDAEKMVEIVLPVSSSFFFPVTPIPLIHSLSWPRIEEYNTYYPPNKNWAKERWVSFRISISPLACLLLLFGLGLNLNHRRLTNCLPDLSKNERTEPRTK